MTSIASTGDAASARLSSARRSVRSLPTWSAHRDLPCVDPTIPPPAVQGSTARAAPRGSAARRARRRSRWPTAGSRRPRSRPATRVSRSSTALASATTSASRSRGTTTTPLPSACTTSPGRHRDPAALDGHVDRAGPVVGAGGGVGAAGERGQPHRVEAVDVADRPVDDQPDAAEVGERLADDVADDRGVLAAAAVDEQDVAGRDEVDRLQHEQDVAGLGPDGDGGPAHPRAAREPADARAHDADRAAAVGDLRGREPGQLGDQRPGPGARPRVPMTHCWGCDLLMVRGC